MQRIPKKPVQNKWDAQRRIQTESADQDDHFDINSLMKKYKRNYGQDYKQFTSSQSNMQKRTMGGSFNYRKPNGQSIDQLRKSTTNANLGNNKNILTRNVNFNRSLVNNHYSNQNTNPDVHSEYFQKQSVTKSQQFQTNHSTVSNNNNNQSSNGHSQLSSTSKTQSFAPQRNSQLTNNNNTNNYNSDVSTRIRTEPSGGSSNTLQLSQNQQQQQQQQQVDPSKYTYSNEKVVGSGTFGVVYKSRIKETGQIVAIKKVLQDKRYKNRELQILQELNHPNVLKMVHAYYTQGDNNDETYLHVVMQYIPETIYSMNRHYIKQKQYMPSILVKLYSYQIMRSLVYIHTVGICHRDIKPHNILVDPQSNRVVMCDFGSAKKLIKGEPNISYICSRCYRAPELIFGAVNYTNQIDMWSTGCVIAEMINGEPLFIGESAIDQLVEIIKVIGTPSKDQVLQMNPEYDLNDYKFPQLKAREWKKVLRPKVDPLCIDFVSKILVYSPIERLNPLQAIAHPYFDELRDEKKLKILSTKIRIPNLFDFTKSELSLAPELTNSVIPSWYMDKYGIKNHH